jgi:hypothetical protein
MMTGTTKVADDIFMVPWDQGNGVIRREIWIRDDGAVYRYHLAYLNQDMCMEDDGRVLGLEYADGELKLYSMGTEKPSIFTSFEEMEERFDVKWSFLPKPNEPAVQSTSNVLPPDDHGEYSETRGMKLSITKGSVSDFFRRGRDVAAKLDRGEIPERHKVVMLASRMDLCYSQMPKKEWASFRGKLASGETKALE